MWNLMDVVEQLLCAPPQRKPFSDTSVKSELRSDIPAQQYQFSKCKFLSEVHLVCEREKSE